MPIDALQMKPMLATGNMEATLEFYCGVLGFELGDKFDIRGFHDTVLDAGPLPLSVLEGQIDAWVARQKAE